MLDEERLTREMIALWESGVDGIIDAFERYCAQDVKWINTGIPSVEDLDKCVELLRAQQWRDYFDPGPLLPVGQL